MSINVQHYIDGKLVTGPNDQYGNIFNPSTGEIRGKCAYASAQTLDSAVTTAATAGRLWAATSHPRRSQVIYKLRELVIKHTDELAVLVGLEHGKTIEDAKGEIGRALEAIEFATNAPHLNKGEYLQNVGGGIDTFSIRQPLGVVGCIAPFNFPFMVPVFMATMAIACGNAVILKPSEKVPSAAMFLCDLWKEAGLPDGVWNVVNGDKEVVSAMLSHPGIAAISFVGSTKIGELIYQQGCHHGKRVAAFTGGKNHMVVMPDADMDQAAVSFLSSAYGSASQRCMAISLLLAVGEGTAERLLERLIPKIEALKVGPYNDTSADFGALVSAEAKQTVNAAIEQALADGATMLVDGRNLSIPGHENGFFCGATMLDNITTDMDFYKEEVFGPARGLMRVASLDEAINITNSHEYGNGAVIFTRDGHSATRFFDEVLAGMIGINVPVPVPTGSFNFGGLRRSKFGEGHLFGPDAVRFFTHIKTMSQRWPAPAAAVQDQSFAFPENK